MRENAGVKNGEKDFVCDKCGEKFSEAIAENALFVCPGCGKYNAFPARKRIAAIADADSFEEFCGKDGFYDPMEFPSYDEKIRVAKEKSGEKEAVVCGKCRIGGTETCIFAMEPRFMMGSMGSAVGEGITRVFEYAEENGLPVVGFTASGGARMQEGIYSLMQMAKVSAAIGRHGQRGLFFLSCLTDPTMGGATASFASLGDVIIAEPKARIGFAGKRVVEQMTESAVDDSFRSAEQLLRNGFVDAVVKRSEQKKFISDMLKFHTVRSEE